MPELLDVGREGVTKLLDMETLVKKNWEFQITTKTLTLMDPNTTTTRQPTGVFDDVDLSVAPMAIEDVEKRLSALHEIDKVGSLLDLFHYNANLYLQKIIKLLHTASEAIDHLKAGKTATDILSTEACKTQFTAATKQYYTTLEDVTVSVRREIRMLSNVSRDKVLPISLVPKAQWVGALKEAEIWSSVDGLLENSDKKPRELSVNEPSAGGDDPGSIQVDEAMEDAGNEGDSVLQGGLQQQQQQQQAAPEIVTTTTTTTETSVSAYGVPDHIDLSDDEEDDDNNDVVMID